MIQDLFALEAKLSDATRPAVLSNKAKIVGCWKGNKSKPVFQCQVLEGSKDKPRSSSQTSQKKRV